MIVELRLEIDDARVQARIDASYDLWEEKPKAHELVADLIREGSAGELVEDTPDAYFGGKLSAWVNGEVVLGDVDRYVVSPERLSEIRALLKGPADESAWDILPTEGVTPGALASAVFDLLAERDAR